MTEQQFTEQQAAFLRKIAGPALDSERTFKIPAAITAAQAILESAGKVKITGAAARPFASREEWQWGGSPLFIHANNPFGIKYSHKDGDPYGAYNAETAEYVGGAREMEKLGFQHFVSLDEAFAAHARLLWTARYALFAYECGTYAGAILQNDPEGAGKSLQAACNALGPKTGPNDSSHCGYATDPKYGQKLYDLIREYGLDDAATLKAFTTESMEIAQGAAIATDVGSGDL